MKVAVACLSLLMTGLFFAVAPSSAEELKLPDGLTMTFTLPDGWTYSRQAPQFLVEETVEHVTHELADQGKEVDAGQLRDAVNRRLATNEGFVYQPESHSMLLIDFSPLREGEAAPGRETVAQSARYAARELHQEEGAADVAAGSERTSFSGMPFAYRVDATYTMHDKPRRFIGIVGFRSPYWIYLYYTDTLTNNSDRKAMEELLQTARLTGANGG
jgi:hypothetical protein